MKKLIVLILAIIPILFFAKTTAASTLSLLPSSGSYSTGQIFTVNILLNTQGQAVDGVDIRYLNYNPSQLEVQDDNISLTGIQITPGSLLTNTVANSVDAINGRISFSQVATGGSSFTNNINQTLANVRFRVLGTFIGSSVSFSFISSSTSDTNVASAGSDVLTSVTNASYDSGDTTTPAAISNLSASSPTTNSVTLSWTAPGDDGISGTAASYDIRYSTANITEANWASATQVSGEPLPQIAGTNQSMTISGLSTATTYYFAMKTSDEVPNTSALSNIISATTQSLTLLVSLSANPNLGVAPVNNVDLTATVTGNATGNINYTFYCNRSDAGTNITTPYDVKFDNQTQTTFTAFDLCGYSNAGTYSPKIIVERGSLQAESRTAVTVSSPPTSNKFSNNDRIKTNSTVNVRQTPSASGTLLGTQILGAGGTVIGGPTFVDGYWWWQINYDSGADGWSVESFLDLPPTVSSARFRPYLEALSNLLNRSFTFTLKDSATLTQRAQFSAMANTQNEAAIPTTVREDDYEVLTDSQYYLKVKRTNTSVASNLAISLTTLRAGDLNDDGIINSLDWSVMNTNWFTSAYPADINGDSLVNSLDFSWLNKNWLLSDEN